MADWAKDIRRRAGKHHSAEERERANATGPGERTNEIIRIVAQSHLPVTRTPGKPGIPETTFYRWYDRYLSIGEAGVEDRPPRPGRIWNDFGYVLIDATISKIHPDAAGAVEGKRI